MSGGFIAGQHNASRYMLATAEITPPDLKEPDAVCTAILIALRGRQQSGKQRRPHDLHVFGNRVRQHPRATTKGRCLCFGEEAPGDRLVQSTGGRRATHLPLHTLGRCCGRLGNAVGTRKRR